MFRVVVSRDQSVHVIRIFGSVLTEKALYLTTRVARTLTAPYSYSHLG